MNLCTNASQATAGRGAIDVTLDTIEGATERNLSHGTLPAGRYIRLTVTDNGPGMDRAVMERIFEPFFTTKGPGRGTGLGLASVHGIVTQHGGALNVRSRRGAGSTFEAYFPQTEEVARDDRQGEAAAAALGQGETVLFVDDETPLVALGEEMLARLGYEPVGFQDSTAALASFHADPQRFDLVLTDEVMPEMTGTELATELHRIRPDLPIILMTGYVESISRGLAAAGIREVLKKPLLSRPLATCLARYLPAKQAAEHRTR
jgi:CheY-like chemotaxis protein